MRIELGNNLDNVEIKDGFDPIPPGTYTLTVAKMPEIDQGKKGPYVAWEFEIVEAEDTDLNKRKIFHNTSLSERALGMPTGIKALLQNIGLPWDDTGFDGSLSVGLRCSADVENRIVTEKDDEGNIVTDKDGNPKQNIYDDIVTFYEVY